MDASRYPLTPVRRPPLNILSTTLPTAGVPTYSRLAASIEQTLPETFGGHAVQFGWDAISLTTTSPYPPSALG
jgi:hypothetical protein